MFLAGELSQFAATVEGEFPEALLDPKILTIAFAGVAALILWGFIHTTFVRPFILVGVLRNFTAEGMKDIPAESSFSILDGKSPKLEKLRASGY